MSEAKDKQRNTKGIQKGIQKGMVDLTLVRQE